MQLKICLQLLSKGKESLGSSQYRHLKKDHTLDYLLDSHCFNSSFGMVIKLHSNDLKKVTLSVVAVASHYQLEVSSENYLVFNS